MDKLKYYKKIVLTKQTVIKEGPPELLKIEFEKTKHAYNIFKKSEILNTPKVLCFNEQKGELIFERIKDISNVKQFQDKSFNSITIASKIGKCLANIHMYYSLPDNFKIPLPSKLRDMDSKQVFIHGDVTGDNILINNTNEDIYFIDWMMTRKHEGKATFGTAYFDIAWFLNYQFYSTVNINYLRRNIEKEAYAYLKSYSDTLDYYFDLFKFKKYLIRFINYKIYLRKKELPKHIFILLWPAHKRFLNFAEKLQIK